ncbi:MAG: hypothetical protein ACI4SO_07625 [Muribaculaceae bacterium]
MEKFKFHQDVKVSVWIRQTFDIEAASKEAAVDKAKEYIGRDVTADVETLENEILYDTEEILYPCDNNGYHTIELYDESMNLIGKNAD